MEKRSQSRILAALLAPMFLCVGCVTVDPLTLAAKQGDADQLAQLLTEGANVNQADYRDRTLLINAAMGELTGTTIVVDAGGNMRETQHPGADEYLAAVDLLLERGADPNLRDKDGMTALDYAAVYNRTATASALLAAGADTGGSGHGETPLRLASSNGRELIVDLLLEAGADPDATNISGDTPLMTAAAGGYTAIMTKLLSVGVAIDASSEGGDTPLSNAAWGGYPQAVKLLLEHGAPVNSRDALDRTPLRIAIDRGYVDCADLLRAAGGVE